MNINARTKLNLIIGNPVAHSLSPQIHNAGYEALGIDDQFVLVATEITDLSDFMTGIRSMKYVRGLSCTIPYKQAVVPLLDELDETAKVIGAVNSIINTDGRLKGYNTDWIGFRESIIGHSELRGKKVALIGAGGAARAVLYALTREGAEVTIYNRTVDKAQQLAQEFHCDYASLEAYAPMQSADIIVNTTPLGMSPHNEENSPIPKDVMQPGQFVFDIVYTPYQTKLLQDAEARGATPIHGVDMLIHQALAQFKLCTGLEGPEDVMRRKALELLGATE